MQDLMSSYVDATGTLQVKNAAGSVSDEELHRAILVTQAMRFSKVMTTDQWIEFLTLPIS